MQKYNCLAFVNWSRLSNVILDPRVCVIGIFRLIQYIKIPSSMNHRFQTHKERLWGRCEMNHTILRNGYMCQVKFPLWVSAPAPENERTDFGVDFWAQKRRYLKVYTVHPIVRYLDFISLVCYGYLAF